MLNMGLDEENASNILETSDAMLTKAWDKVAGKLKANTADPQKSVNIDLFRSLSDYELYKVRCKEEELTILGNDFKSLYDCYLLYAVDVSLKLILSEFPEVNYLALNIYESKFLFREMLCDDATSLVSNIFQYDIVFCPIHKINHYILLIIDAKQSSLHYFNSNNMIRS